MDYSQVTKVWHKSRNLTTRLFASHISKINAHISIRQNMASQAVKTPGTEYSPHKRTRIALGAELGLTRRQLWQKEGVNPASIKGITKRYRVQKSAKSSPRSGRPRKLDERDIRHFLILIAKDPFISAEKLIADSGVTCHPRTVSRALIKRGIQHFKAIRRPKLTPEAARKRLEFARQHIGKTSSYWRRWIFADESTVARGDGDRDGWVFCRSVGQLSLAITYPY